MSIAEFIRESVLRPQLQKRGALIVYDADERYRDLCFDLETDSIRVVNASESSIESREAALQGLRDLTQATGALQGLVIYVPRPQPQSNQERQIDPFSIYTRCGATFPGVDDGNNYLSLCLRALPDHGTAIRKVFEETPGGPSFAVIDAIAGGGASWPQLRTLLKVESAREILTALLAPSAMQADALKEQEGWVQEARDFLQATLGLKLKTRGKTWGSVANELWRYVLFSEFVFDLPGQLPEALQVVPHAPAEAQPVVEDVCDQLRNNPNTRDGYIERAEAIEAELNLPALCQSIDDLGQRDTFPFEERTFLRQAIAGIVTGQTDSTRELLARQSGSVWKGKGESQAQWGLVRVGLALVEACDDLERQLPEHTRSQADLIDFYLTHLREGDRLQREFEQAVGSVFDPHDSLAEVVARSRSSYRQLVEKVQAAFVRHLESAGWPPSGRLANVDVFDQLVAPGLKESGRKVAYLMVDALRYELGVVLEKLIGEDHPVQAQAAYAQLPSITLVGMASLLPGARDGLQLAQENGSLVPRLNGTPVSNVTQRMGVLVKQYGDRFAEMQLNEFVRSKPKIAQTVDLLVLRSTEIDSQLENNPESTLGLIPATLKSIRFALHKLRDLGFTEAVIVTDHGFFLNAHAQAGDVCQKPEGKWLNMHDRLMLGDGVSDVHNLVMDAGKLGIHGDFAQAALPRSMAPYRAGHLYFHGGASLAEAVVPVLCVNFESQERVPAGQVQVGLGYKNGATRVTTFLPVLGLSLATQDLLAQDMEVEILLEAQDKKGNVVGEVSPGAEVNPATGTVTLLPGQSKRIALRMDDDFRGKFKVLALNPSTLATYASLELETDYTE